MISKLFDIEPNVDALFNGLPELSLKDLVFNHYYDIYKNVKLSEFATKEYFAQLLFQYSQQEMKDGN